MTPSKLASDQSTAAYGLLEGIALAQKEEEASQRSSLIDWFARHPVQAARLYRCLFRSESWNWQFRGDPAPTVLLRQTWQRI